jgi:hypothetical protein
MSRWSNGDVPCRVSVHLSSEIEGEEVQRFVEPCYFNKLAHQESLVVSSETGISDALVCQDEVSDEEAKTRVWDTNTSNLLVRLSATISCIARGSSVLDSGLKRGLGEASWYTYQMSLVGFM